MRLNRRMLGALALSVVVLVTVGCDGSDDSGAVGDCSIEANTSCPGADLSGSDLSGADLSRADLSGTNLEGTNLSGANLSEANLSLAQIVDTDLSDADLTGANLEGATITGTNLDGATLCGTIRTDGTTDDTSCPESTDTTETDTTGTDTTETDASGEATVTSLDVTTLSCASGATDGTVTVSWQTEQSTAVRVSLDGTAVEDSGPTGSADVTVPCDGDDHEVSVTALSDAGDGETESETVSTS